MDKGLEYRRLLERKQLILSYKIRKKKKEVDKKMLSALQEQYKIKNKCYCFIYD